jgi:hypothetical protein
MRIRHMTATGGRVREILPKLVVSMALVAGVAVPSPHASSAAANDCKSLPGRLRAPESFAMESCFDGKKLFLHNGIDVVIKLKVTGDGAVGTRTAGDISILELVMKALVPDAAVILPDFTGIVEVGRGQAVVELTRDDVNDDYYTLTKIALQILPLPDIASAGAGQYEAIVRFIRNLSGIGVSYRKCLAENKFFGKIGCQAAAGANVVNIVSRLFFDIGLTALKTVKPIASKLVGVLAFAPEFISTTYRRVADFDIWKLASKRAEVVPEVDATQPGIQGTSATTAPKVESAPEPAEAASFVARYFVAAQAGRYEEAWQMLTPAYQQKYVSFEKFKSFWRRIAGVGIDSTVDAGVSDRNTRTITVAAWFDLNDGSRSNETVDVDVSRGENGQFAIDDYRPKSSRSSRSPGTATAPPQAPTTCEGLNTSILGPSLVYQRAVCTPSWIMILSTKSTGELVASLLSHVGSSATVLADWTNLAAGLEISKFSAASVETKGVPAATAKLLVDTVNGFYSLQAPQSPQPTSSSAPAVCADLRFPICPTTMPDDWLPGSDTSSALAEIRDSIRKNTNPTSITRDSGGIGLLGLGWSSSLFALSYSRNDKFTKLTDYCGENALGEGATVRKTDLTGFRSSLFALSCEWTSPLPGDSRYLTKIIWSDGVFTFEVSEARYNGSDPTIIIPEVGSLIEAVKQWDVSTAAIEGRPR